ncbi:MAG: hypothetical protein PHV51_03620 [Methanosarcinaceae archaeon]|nr:hypothetical protein [Methanosarcinaceae archaeon]
MIAGNCHLAAAEISDIYPEVPGTDMPGVTFRITVLGDSEAGKVEKEVMALLCGLGCREREKNPGVAD